jgi:GTP cyclohydrolase III
MYNVKPNIFQEFLQNSKLLVNLEKEPNQIPCIIQFMRGDIIMAKVEVLNFDEFQKVVSGQEINKKDNTYWIRGKEWEKDPQGNPIQELKV